MATKDYGSGDPRQAARERVNSTFGVSEEQIQFLDEVITPSFCRVEITIAYEMWIKRGVGSVDVGEGEAELYTRAYALALHNAQNDPRPQRKRLP